MGKTVAVPIKCIVMGKIGAMPVCCICILDNAQHRDMINVNTFIRSLIYCGVRGASVRPWAVV